MNFNIAFDRVFPNANIRATNLNKFYGCFSF